MHLRYCSDVFTG